jgi:type III secretion protein W
LIQTTEGDFQQTIIAAKEDLHIHYQREIIAGHNMGTEARRYADQGLADPSTLRDIYREVTGNPKEPAVLFDEFSKHFDFEHMQPLIGFLLHSLGRDLKSKGPSIPSAELQRLVTETRTMQAILGIYRYFQGSMGRIGNAFQRDGLNLPPTINFEILAKLLVKLLQDRYPNTDKILQMGKLLEISEELLAQMIIYTQMKDGLRHIAPKMFRSQKHKKDLQLLFIEALEDLEDALEKENDKDEEEEEE